MPRIDFSPPDVTEEDIAAVAAVLRSGWITTASATKDFERSLATWCQTPRVACLNSATAALECALRVLGIGPGDEVITSAYTYTASASVIAHVGARPVLVDVAPGSYELDAQALRAALSPRTRALISVDVAGVMCDYDAIFAVLRDAAVAPTASQDEMASRRDEIARGGESTVDGKAGNGDDWAANSQAGKAGNGDDWAANNQAGKGGQAGGTHTGDSIAEQLIRELGRIPVIADAAHSFGATYKGRPSGSVADLSAFSFHAVKNITTAEGGALTWRPGLAEQLMLAWREVQPGIFGANAGEALEAPGSTAAAPEAPGSTAAAPEAPDDALYRLLMLFSLHGQNKDARSKAQTGAWEYDIVAPWYKCNMTDVAAALGASQLQRYAQTLQRRHQIIKHYRRRLLADAAAAGYELDIIEHVSADGASVSSGHLLLVRLLGRGDAFRRRFIQEMWSHEVSCNVHYKPLPLLSAYGQMGFAISDFPEALAQYENEVTLPLHTLLSDADVDYVCDCFRAAYAACRQAAVAAGEPVGPSDPGPGLDQETES